MNSPKQHSPQHAGKSPQKSPQHPVDTTPSECMLSGLFFLLTALFFGAFASRQRTKNPPNPPLSHPRFPGLRRRVSPSFFSLFGLKWTGFR